MTRAAAAAALLAAPALCAAWGGDGHETVGAIADRLIAGTPAERNVRRLLGGMTLQTAALWADCAKGVSSSDGVHFAYTAWGDYGDCKPFEAVPDEIARQIDFVARNWKQCGGAAGNETCHKHYHYTDVSHLRDHYAETLQGTAPYDVVHAIDAAVAVLRGREAPPPFAIATPREALLLLAHYVGDVHQPLHVEATYLDARGRNVDPDKRGRVDPATDTVGGNRLLDHGQNFHSEWDAVPAALRVSGSGFDDLLAHARAIAPTPGDAATWAAQWASETVVAGKPAFARLKFAPQPPARPQAGPSWNVSGVDAAYKTRAAAIKADRLAHAGARLAQVLAAVWPNGEMACGAVPPSSSAGYLKAVDLPDVTTWLPPAPAAGSARQAADDEAIQQTRALLAQPRGQEAAEDDVFAPAALARRFEGALGVALDACSAPHLLALIAKAQHDADALVAPVKRTVAEGGRPRPFVAAPALSTCLAPVDIAGKRHEDLEVFQLDRSGSYPSTHALVGLFVGMLLTELAPDRGAALLAWGLGFGDSRVVCGFHYPSDVEGGRLAAAALWARLRAEPAFAADLQAARLEVHAARGL